jgi:hypothetical protein
MQIPGNPDAGEPMSMGKKGVFNPSLSTEDEPAKDLQ